MSHQAVDAVLHSSLPRRLRMVAAVLAHYADADGGRIRPSNQTIAACAGIDKREVQRHVAELRSLGVLELVRAGGAGARCCNEYRMHVDRLIPRMDGDSPMGGDSTTLKGGGKGGDKGGEMGGASTTQSRIKDQGIERAHANGKPGAWIRSDTPEAREQLRREKQQQLEQLEAEYTAAGFRAAARYESPTSYRTAFTLWQQQRRATAAESRA